MNAWRTYETPESETKDYITYSTAGGLNISIFVSVSFAPQFHKDKADGPRWMSSHMMGCVLGKES